MTGAKFDQTVAKLIVRAVGMLGCLFVALKLAGYITWSWVWVLVPFWMWAVPLPLYIIMAIRHGRMLKRYRTSKP